jgi:hypothetical protein
MCRERYINLASKPTGAVLTYFIYIRHELGLNLGLGATILWFLLFSSVSKKIIEITLENRIRPLFQHFSKFIIGYKRIITHLMITYRQHWIERRNNQVTNKIKLYVGTACQVVYVIWQKKWSWYNHAQSTPDGCSQTVAVKPGGPTQLTSKSAVNHEPELVLSTSNLIAHFLKIHFTVSIFQISPHRNS